MPIYEFNCSTCDRPFEELLRSSAAAAEVACPKCGSRKVQRKLSLFASKAAIGLSTPASASAANCAPSGG